MDRTVVERRLAGAHTEGNFVTPGPVSANGAAVAKVRTLMVLDERCSGCTWTADCSTDRTCWKRERELLAEVGRYRKRERLGTLTGTVADVEPVSRATGRANAVGSGENAHEWIDSEGGPPDPADPPPLAEVAQPVERPPILAGDASSTPALRFALLEVLDSLRALVDAVLPEEAE